MNLREEVKNIVGDKQVNEVVDLIDRVVRDSILLKPSLTGEKPFRYGFEWNAACWHLYKNYERVFNHEVKNIDGTIISNIDELV